MFENDYITIPTLQRRLGLPRSYVDRLVEQRIIPTIDVNGKKRTTEIDARAALDKLATKGGGSDG